MPEQAYEKSRINISYKSKVKGGENVKLPLRMLVMGNFNPESDPNEPLRERRKWRVDKGTFNSTMAEMGTNLDVNVADKIHKGGEDAMLEVQLRFRNRDDFTPGAIIEQLDDLRDLREVRDEVKRLAGEMTKDPSVAKRLTAVLKDPKRVAQLFDELKGARGDAASE